MPLIANGDIKTPQDAEACFGLGCDGVMIGRGAMQQPWVFRDIRHYLRTGELLPPPSLPDRFEMCIAHLRAQAAYRGNGGAWCRSGRITRPISKVNRTSHGCEVT